MKTESDIESEVMPNGGYGGLGLKGLTLITKTDDLAPIARQTTPCLKTRSLHVHRRCVRNQHPMALKSDGAITILRPSG